jgi:hypothetical protein
MASAHTASETEMAAARVPLGWRDQCSALVSNGPRGIGTAAIGSTNKDEDGDKDRQARDKRQETRRPQARCGQAARASMRETCPAHWRQRRGRVRRAGARVVKRGYGYGYGYGSRRARRGQVSMCARTPGPRLHARFPSVLRAPKPIALIPSIALVCAFCLRTFLCLLSWTPSSWSHFPSPQSQFFEPLQ